MDGGGDLTDLPLSFCCLMLLPLFHSIPAPKHPSIPSIHIHIHKPPNAITRQQFLPSPSCKNVIYFTPVFLNTPTKRDFNYTFQPLSLYLPSHLPTFTDLYQSIHQEPVSRAFFCSPASFFTTVAGRARCSRNVCRPP